MCVPVLYVTTRVSWYVPDPASWRSEDLIEAQVLFVFTLQITKPTALRYQNFVWLCFSFFISHLYWCFFVCVFVSCWDTLSMFSDYLCTLLNVAGPVPVIIWLLVKWNNKAVLYKGRTYIITKMGNNRNNFTNDRNFPQIILRCNVWGKNSLVLLLKNIHSRRSADGRHDLHKSTGIWLKY